MTTIRERHQTYRNDGRDWCRDEGREAPCDAATLLAALDQLVEALAECLRYIPFDSPDGQWFVEHVARAAIAQAKEASDG